MPSSEHEEKIAKAVKGSILGLECIGIIKEESDCKTHIDDKEEDGKNMYSQESMDTLNESNSKIIKEYEIKMAAEEKAKENEIILSARRTGVLRKFRTLWTQAYESEEPDGTMVYENVFTENFYHMRGVYVESVIRLMGWRGYIGEVIQLDLPDGNSIKCNYKEVMYDTDKSWGDMLIDKLKDVGIKINIDNACIFLQIDNYRFIQFKESPPKYTDLNIIYCLAGVLLASVNHSSISIDKKYDYLIREYYDARSKDYFSLNPWGSEH